MGWPLAGGHRGGAGRLPTAGTGDSWLAEDTRLTAPAGREPWPAEDTRLTAPAGREPWPAEDTRLTAPAGREPWPAEDTGTTAPWLEEPLSAREPFLAWDAPCRWGRQNVGGRYYYRISDKEQVKHPAANGGGPVPAAPAAPGRLPPPGTGDPPLAEDAWLADDDWLPPDCGPLPVWLEEDPGLDDPERVCAWLDRELERARPWPDDHPDWADPEPRPGPREVL